MDEAFAQLMHPGTIVFGVSVVILTFFIRRLIETAIPSVKKKADENHPDRTYETTFARYWNQVILYMLPPGTGSLIGIMDIPYLHGDNGPGTMGGRIFAGIFVGGVSAMIYKTAKKRWGIDLDQTFGASVVPAEPPAEPPAEA